MPQLTFGNAPVPFTVAWSGEEQFTVSQCRFAGRRMAICQETAPGKGKPQFGKPHSQRQRQAVAMALCDTCGKSLRYSTKISLSHAGVRSNGAEGPAVLQVEPLLHRDCAAISLRHCPSLRRDVRNGTLMIRQVTRWRAQFAIMDPEFVAHYVPGYVARPTDRIIGHGKVELLAWHDRDEEWLSRGETNA